MSKLIIFFILLFLNAQSLTGQKHALGLTVNAIHNFNTYSEDSIVDEDNLLPLFIIREYGLEYTYAIKEGRNKLYFALFNVSQGIKVRRRIDAEIADSLNDRFPTSASYGNDFALKLGMQHVYKSIELTGGVSMRHIVQRPEGGLGGPLFGDILYTGLANREYLISTSIHPSLFLKINIDLKIFNNSRERFALNFISNFGLQPVQSSTSRLENIATGEVSEWVFVNRGTYLGIGLTYSRNSEDKFCDIFKFRR